MHQRQPNTLRRQRCSICRLLQMSSDDSQLAKGKPPQSRLRHQSVERCCIRTSIPPRVAVALRFVALFEEALKHYARRSLYYLQDALNNNPYHQDDSYYSQSLFVRNDIVKGQRPRASLFTRTSSLHRSCLWHTRKTERCCASLINLILLFGGLLVPTFPRIATYSGLYNGLSSQAIGVRDTRTKRHS
jgi:hypothetical protein